MNSIWGVLALLALAPAYLIADDEPIHEPVQKAEEKPVFRFSLMGGGMRPWKEVTVSSPLGLVPEGDESSFSGSVTGIALNNDSGDANATQQKVRELIDTAIEAPTLNARLRALSDVGKKFADDYNGQKKGDFSNRNGSKDSVLLAARNDVPGDGGICGPIHALINDFQKALGFEHVGMHTVLWKRDSNLAQSGGHALSHFRDPETGKYYIQNYDTIVDLHTTDFREALERSLALHSPLTGMTYVQSRDRRVHQYIGNRSRWIHGQLYHSAFYDRSGANLELNLSNLQQSAGFSYGWDLGEEGNGKVRVFAGHTRFDGSNGEQNLSYMGAALDIGNDLQFQSGPIDSIFVNLRTFMAAHRFATPQLAPDSTKNGDEWERYSGAAGIETHGKLRMGPFTAKTDFELSSTDIGNVAANDATRPFHAFENGLEFEVPKVPFLSFEVTRRINLVPHTLNNDSSLTVKTVFDYGGIIIDSRNATDSDAIYLVNRAGVFVLEGFGNIAGYAVRNLLELVVRTGKFGEFFANADVTMVLDNKKEDPIYGKERDFAYTVQFGYRYPVHENVTLSVGAGIRSENQGLYFLRPQLTRPDLQDGEENFFIEGGMELHFSRGRQIPETAYRMPRDTAARPRRIVINLLNRAVERNRAPYQRILVTHSSGRGYDLIREEKINDSWSVFESRFAPDFNSVEAALAAIPGFDKMYGDANANPDWRAAIQLLK